MLSTSTIPLCAATKPRRWTAPARCLHRCRRSVNGNCRFGRTARTHAPGRSPTTPDRYRRPRAPHRRRRCPPGRSRRYRPGCGSPRWSRGFRVPAVTGCRRRSLRGYPDRPGSRARWPGRARRPSHRAPRPRRSRADRRACARSVVAHRAVRASGVFDEQSHTTRLTLDAIQDHVGVVARSLPVQLGEPTDRGERRA